MKQEEIKKTLGTIPELPGSYQYYNAEGELIYIGKAKNLRRRISSYFQKTPTDRKTRLLVSQIASLTYTIVNTEADALLLENSLIKKHLPRYNVLLKDGKSYPSIVIYKECFPRIEMTRNLGIEHAEYFGPYTSVATAKMMIELLQDLYHLRSCKLQLTPGKIAEGKYKVCLKYHIKKCDAPCVGLVKEADYLRSIDEARELLKGKLGTVIRLYKEEMYAAAATERYELAQLYKARLELLERYAAKQTVAPQGLSNVDVFSIESDEQIAYINYMHVAEGIVSQASTVEYKRGVEEDIEDIFATAICELREQFGSDARELILPFDPGWGIASLGAKVTIPERGDKKKLLHLSELNARQYKIDQLKRSEKLNPEQRSTALMQRTRQDLHLNRAPRHIECFDNSNIQGSSPVASCVVFVNGKPAKKLYRKFHVKTVVGSDDFASMREIIERRYRRLLDEGEPLPDLVVIDGGKGQLSSAYSVLKDLELTEKISVIGIAKRLEEVFFPNDPIPLILDKNSETLKVLQHIRNESHRFAIAFHRDVRSKNQVRSALDDIPGIGVKTKELLLKTFRSVQGIKSADETEIKNLIGLKKTQLLLDGLKEKE